MEALLSILEARRFLGISAAGFYRLIGRAEIAVVKIGGRSLVEPQALRELIAAKRTLRTHPGKNDDPVGAGSLVESPADQGGGDAPG